MSARVRWIVLGALLLCPVAAPGVAAPAELPLMVGSPTVTTAPADVEFLVGSQTLLLKLPSGVVPRVSELRRPARLVVDVPRVVLAPGRAAFGSGQVTSYEIVHADNGSRVVLFLRSPLKRKPTIAYVGGRVVIAVVPGLAPAPGMLAPASPNVFASPRERPVPVPTSSGPTSRITPVPVPTGTGPLPVPREIPPIHPSMREGAGGPA